MKLETMTWIALGLSLVLGLFNHFRTRSLKRAVSARLATVGRNPESIAAPPGKDPLLANLWSWRDDISESITDNLGDPELRSLVEGYRRQQRLMTVAGWVIAILLALAAVLRLL